MEKLENSLLMSLRNSDCKIFELFDFDKSFKSSTKKLILGTDESGRGPGAAGVFAACVHFYPKQDKNFFSRLSSLNDSKKLNEKTREYLYEVILETSVNSVVEVDVDTIEKINILQASLLAMKTSCKNVISKLEVMEQDCCLLIDGSNIIKNFNICQKKVVKGDTKSISIAAASILAKVLRDRKMKDIDKLYPQYGFAKNKGYLTKQHLEAIDKYGMCPYHRPSFLKKHFNRQLQLFN